MITFHAIGADGMPERFPGRPAGAVLEACAAAAVMARGQAYKKPWVHYIVSHDGQPVGTCGFKNAPADGRVGVVFETFPDYDGRGFAAAMLNALGKIARHAMPGIVLTTYTAPQEDSTTAMLEKCGFQYIGMVEDPESGLVWEWCEGKGTISS